MKKNLLTCFLLALLSACTSPPLASENKRPPMDLKMPDKGNNYFPEHKSGFDPNVNDSLSAFSNNWYSSHFRSLKLPVLYTLNGEGEVYRYTNLGTWSHPFTYQLTKIGTKIDIIHRSTNGRGGYESGQLIDNDTETVTVENWEWFKSKITETGFWKQPTHIKVLGLDGAQWILEGYSDGKYHLIDRWSPDNRQSNPFVDICTAFEELFRRSGDR